MSKAESLDHWREICDDPAIAGLPYKVETTATGKIIMSPPKNRHSLLQGVVYDLLRANPSPGIAIVEFVLFTTDGVKVPDVVWGSADWYREFGGADVATKAPELSVEIMSRSNTLAEMERKALLYFEQGAMEFMMVDLKGFVTILAPVEGLLSGPGGVDGMEKIAESRILPSFPSKIQVPEL